MRYLNPKNLLQHKTGFTLAEIMVVLFVLTVILAAFAPMMTTRTKVNGTSPWRYSSPDTANAYFGAYDNQRAMIGQRTVNGTEDIDNKLTINTPEDTAAILFKEDGTAVGQLFHNDSSLILGGSGEDEYTGGEYNTFIGAGSGASGSDALTTSAQYNTAVGYNTLSSLTTGKYNAALGYNALSSLTSSTYNTAVGYNALSSLNSSSSTNMSNTAVGALAASKLTYGTGVTALGGNALATATTGGYDSVAVGYNALATATTGNYNIAIGPEAGSGITTGSNNIAIGPEAGPGITTGSNNIAIGYMALKGVSGLSNIVGIGDYACYNTNVSVPTTCIGYYSGTSNNTTTNRIYLGSKGTTIYIAAGSYTLESYINYLIANYSSDERLKNITGENNTGLEKIKQMQTYDYTLKSDKKSTPYTGVIAQEVQKFFPEAVFTGEDGYLKIRKDALFFAVINAIKELAAHDSDKDLKIQELEKKNAELEERIQKLEENFSTLSSKKRR